MNALCHPSTPAPGMPIPVEARRRLASGETLYEAGSPRTALFSLRAGFMMAVAPQGAGGRHIVRFLLPGDVAGLDGFATGLYQTGLVALGDCEVCEIPVYRAEMLADFSARIGAHMRALIAEELARSQEHAATIARLDAEQRVAFLLRDFARRWRGRGYSESSFRLPMGRREIGEHLGLTMETVSRILSGMRARGWIRLPRGGVEILRPAELESALARPRPPAPPATPG